MNRPDDPKRSRHVPPAHENKGVTEEAAATDFVQMAYEAAGPTPTVDTDTEDAYDEVLRQSFPASDPPPFP